MEKVQNLPSSSKLAWSVDSYPSASQLRIQDRTSIATNDKLQQWPLPPEDAVEDVVAVVAVEDLHLAVGVEGLETAVAEEVSSSAIPA